jgi:arylsulfatase A-like enzyme
VLEAANKLGLSDRLTEILTSDHGEAFGEHGTRFHATTIYDELLRVPLIIHGPQIRARRIKTPVSLVDIAPTLLDMFQLPTPGEYMGQSLTPLLAGKNFEFSRPIAADSRLKRSIVFPGGWKVIHNERLDATEVYNLKRDPKELKNLHPLPELEDEVVLLHAFFEQHRLRKDGYEPPYRK